MSKPSFEDFAAFVRDCLRISMKKQITRDTEFEQDLGCTGDDGEELLLATEKRYNVGLSRKSFDLKDNEYLFHDEGSGLLAGLIDLFKRNRTLVRRFTVGNFHDAVCRAGELDQQGSLRK